METSDTPVPPVVSAPAPVPPAPGPVDPVVAVVTLTPVEARVLGSLIEKELTTPEYCPLTINALTAACNQKSNRDPVMTLDSQTVLKTLDTLRDKHLAWEVTATGSRVLKYRHNFAKVYAVSKEELCLVCELLVRGPQTIGELRTHTERMCSFPDLAAATTALRKLIERPGGALVAQLPKESGRRECRYAHLLCGPVSAIPADVRSVPSTAASSTVESSLEARLVRVEADVALLKAELSALKTRATLVP